jgi:Tfx family DNA-binding protein
LVRRYRDTFLTDEQVKVLRMRSEGMSVDEIAQRMGVSKACIHAVLRKAMKTVERSKNTLKLYAKIVGGVTLSFSAGTSIQDFVKDIFRAADEHGIKIGMGSLNLFMKVMKSLPKCLDLEREQLICSLEVIVKRDGDLLIREGSNTISRM